MIDIHTNKFKLAMLLMLLTMLMMIMVMMLMMIGIGAIKILLTGMLRAHYSYSVSSTILQRFSTDIMSGFVFPIFWC